MSASRWRQFCLDHIAPNSQVSIKISPLSFTQLRQYFTILNVVLLERNCQARIEPSKKWAKPPIIPPYHREPLP
ncbi:MAG: hypothetical protein Q7S64_01900 [bacterium]|nr:hypothetical protein [bacterium]